MSISLLILTHPDRWNSFFAIVSLAASLAAPCSSAEEFKATGHTDPDHKAPPNKQVAPYGPGN